MKLFFAIFAVVAILVIGVGAIASMDIAPEQQLVRRVVEINPVN